VFEIVTWHWYVLFGTIRIMRFLDLSFLSRHSGHVSVIED
jgi:hypothetical protein